MSQSITKLQSQIDALKYRLDNLSIRGGHNVLVSKTGNDFVIDAFTGSSVVAEVDLYPYKLSTQSENEVVNIYCRAGTTNGFLQKNAFKSVGRINDGEVKYVYLELESDGIEVTSVNIEVTDESSDTLGVQFSKDVVPAKAQKLLGVVTMDDSAVKITQVIFTNLRATPKVVFSEGSDNPNFIHRYWAWEFYQE